MQSIILVLLQSLKVNLDWQQSLILFSIKFMADIQCIFESMTGQGSIYISNFAAAEDINLLNNLGIKAILSVAKSGLLHHSKEQIPYYLYIPAKDHQSYEMQKHFNQTYDFIENARKETNVLVHCMVGVSRSVTIVMAYLLKKYKYSLNQVISMVQRKRKKINPNKGFIEQLKKYAQQQGLKCDFQGVQVPNVRQRSNSKHKRMFSVETKPSLHKNHFLSNPLAYCQENLMIKQKRIQNTITQNYPNKEIIYQNIEKKISFEQICEENLLKKIGSAETREENIENTPSPGKRQGPKKENIEEKINRLRDKMNKRQKMENHKRSSSVYRQYDIKDKQNDLAKLSGEINEQESKNNKISIYLNRNSKNNIKWQINRLQTNENMNLKRQNSNSNDKNMFRTDLKVQEKALFLKLKVSPRGRVSRDNH